MNLFNRTGYRIFHCSLAFAIVLITAVACSAENKPLPKSYSVKPLLFATGFESSDGLTFDTKNNLYAVNYRGNGNLGRVSTEGKASIFHKLQKTEIMKETVPHPSGLKIDKFDRLIVADSGAGRLLRISKTGDKAEVLADRYMGNRFSSIENIAVSVKLDIYFTDTGGIEGQKKAIGAVYRYNIKTSKVSLVAKDLANPGGLAVLHSAEHEPIKLFVAERSNYQILQFDLNKDGTIGKKKVFFKFPEKTVGQIKGGKIEPGGMIFDVEQRLYVVMQQTGTVNVIDGIKSGKPKIIRQYDAGGKDAKNCHFSGESLFISINSKEAIFRLDLGVQGYSYTQDAN